MHNTPWTLRKTAQYANIFGTQPEAHPSLEEWLIDTKNGRYSTSIREVRQAAQELKSAQNDEKEKKKVQNTYDARKAQLPAVLACGDSASRHRIECLLAHNGIIHGDLDKLYDLEAMIALKRIYSAMPEVAYCFVSPGGYGLKIGVLVQPLAAETPEALNEHYKRVWTWIATQMREATGYEWDTNAMDISRLIMVSHDPELYWNPDAQVREVPSRADLPELAVRSTPGKKRTRKHQSALKNDRLWLALVESGARVPSGMRDHTLHRYGCKLRGQGADASAIRQALVALNHRCDPPLPAHVVLKKVAQALRFDPGTRRREAPRFYAKPADTRLYPTGTTTRLYPTTRRRKETPA